MTSLRQLKSDLRALADPDKASFLPRFFKTGKGEYGEGDLFIGVTVPNVRRVVKKHHTLPLQDTIKLLTSPIHEERLCAILILVYKYEHGNSRQQESIYKTYLENTEYINNWDLVDLSAYKIVGDYLLSRDRNILYTLAKSKSLWERRISIIATFQCIKVQKQARDTFVISELLVHDKEDLIHKAVGWMLREVGKRISQETEETFLMIHYKQMPRTMLRYAIEHFPEKKRQAYLKGTI